MKWKTFVGTNDAGATASDPTGGGASGNNMVQVSQQQFDGGTDGGDNNLTQTTAYVDGSTTRGIGSLSINMNQLMLLNRNRSSLIFSSSLASLRTHFGFGSGRSNNHDGTSMNNGPFTTKFGNP